MTETLTEASVPRFSRGFRLRHDAVRGQWVVLGPERAFVPDEIAIEVLRLIDDTTPLGSVIDALAHRFEAPRDQIAGDVLILMNELMARGVVRG